MSGIQFNKDLLSVHAEKCFVESTKIWLAQQIFRLSMSQWKFCFNYCNSKKKKIALSAKKLNCKLKIQIYCNSSKT